MVSIMMIARIGRPNSAPATRLGFRRAVHAVFIRAQLQLVGHLTDVCRLKGLRRHVHAFMQAASADSSAQHDVLTGILHTANGWMRSPARCRCRQARDPGTGASPSCAGPPDRLQLYDLSYSRVVGCTLAMRKLAVHRQQTAAGTPGDTAQPSACHIQYCRMPHPEPEDIHPVTCLRHRRHLRLKWTACRQGSWSDTLPEPQSARAGVWLCGKFDSRVKGPSTARQ